MPVLPERAALVATVLADRAAVAVTAATAGPRMAAARLVAMETRAAGTAARRPEELAAAEGMARLVRLVAGGLVVGVAETAGWLVMAALLVETAARGLAALALPEALPMLVATAAAWPSTPRSAALVATLLADLAATAVTAALAGR